MLLLFCCITQLAWCTWFSSSLVLKPLPVLFCLCGDVASAKVSLPPTCSPGPRVPMSLAGAVFQAASHSPRRPRHAGVSASPCRSDCCGLHHAAADNRSRPWLIGPFMSRVYPSHWVVGAVSGSARASFAVPLLDLAQSQRSEARHASPDYIESATHDGLLLFEPGRPPQAHRSWMRSEVSVHSRHSATGATHVR